MKLIQNEWMKIHAKRTTYYFSIFLLLFSVFVAVVTSQWAPVEMGIDHYLDYAEVNIDGLLSFISIYGAVVGAKIVSDEFQKGTIKQLLLRPQARVAILFSKYAALVLVLIAITVLSAAVTIFIGLLFFHGGATDWTIVPFMRYIVYSIVPVLFYATLSFFLAVILRTSALPLVAALFLMFTESIVVLLLGRYDWAQLLFTFHLHPNVYDSNEIVRGGMMPVMSGFTLFTSLAVVAVYMLIFLAASSLVFHKRDIL